jgi:hypothetical protein
MPKQLAFLCILQLEFLWILQLASSTSAFAQNAVSGTPSEYPSIEAITKNGGCSAKDNTARILKTPNPNDLVQSWSGDSRIGTSWSFRPGRYVQTDIGGGVYLQGDLVSPRGGVTDRNVYILFKEWNCTP